MNLSTILATITLALVLMFLTALTTGWLFMLAIGGLGHIFAIDALFLSYWDSVLAVFLLYVVASLINVFNR